MYRGQQFYMQMDAHCPAVRHWDTLIIQQWKYTGNEMAVLRYDAFGDIRLFGINASLDFFSSSSYLTDLQGSIDANGDSTRRTRPIMCNSEFEGVMPAMYIRHNSQPEDLPVTILSAYFSFLCT